MESAHPNDKVDFVFDHRNELSACIPTYNEMKTCEGFPLMTRAGGCVDGDDKKLPPLQMADLLSGEFLSQVNGNKPSEVWRIIAGARPVAYMPGHPPATHQKIFASQKSSREIQGVAASICKRIYKDKERSIDLVNDVIELMRSKCNFDIPHDQLVKLFKAE